MKWLSPCPICLIASLAIPALASVTVNSPSNGGSMTSPVNYVASSTTSCSKGVSTMGVYVDDQLQTVVNGHEMNTNVSISEGSHKTVVEEWDHCGGASYTVVNLTVSGGGGGGGGNGQFTDLQASKGWVAYGEYPPKYAVCEQCGQGVTWSVAQHQSSPSMSGNSTKYEIGGDHPYSDVLFTLPLIGTHSTQGMPDSDHKIIPSLHNFTYDAYFYSGDLSLSQVLEFDINQYFNGMGFVYGHQCKIAGGHEWDIWDNVNKHWVHTGIACNPVSNGWNHVHLEVERTSDNKMLYKTITFNGETHTINQTYGHFNSGNWYGVGVNYQMDGNSKQTDYKTYMDQFTFTYQ